MIEWNIIKRLLQAFPASFINCNGEFIAEVKTNQYLNLEKCENEFDLKCKILEFFSRGACKTTYYLSQRKNDELHQFVLDGINKFLNTSFTKDDMLKVYEALGNGVDHELTECFVSNGYNMDLLEEDD